MVISYELTGKVVDAFLSGEDNEDYSLSDWVYEVANLDTKLGYWEWVQHQVDAQANEEMHTTNFPTT